MVESLSLLLGSSSLGRGGVEVLLGAAGRVWLLARLLERL